MQRLQIGAALWACAAALLLSAVAFYPAAEPAPAASPQLTLTSVTPVRYGRDIRPLLSDRCFNCHGQDPETREAGLRLDQREPATAERDGARAIVPGDPDASLIWQRIMAHDSETVMPPPHAQKRPLREEDRATIRRWIEQGANFEPHWAFQPPRRSPLPTVTRSDWARDPLDLFILRKMEAANVQPAPASDPGTLLRRVFLDLTGLPPTLEELDAFLIAHEQDADAAYSAWVERLLTEEPYVTRMAERLTVPWLDAARYADTIGTHTDAGRQMWLWRDWVIDAFRRNMPYDQFLTEQIAGDLLPEATTAQQIASGFNRNHVITDEGGAINEEYLVEYAVDRTDTTSSVFLGLTMGCARCHDHKYDPISTDEYYGLFAYFNSIDEPGLYTQDIRNDNRAYQPALTVPTPDEADQLADLRQQVEALRSQAEARAGETDQHYQQFAATAKRQYPWLLPPVREARSTGGATLEVLEDQSVRATGTNPDNDVYHLRYGTPQPGSYNALLLDVLPDETVPDERLGRSENGNAVLTGLSLTLQRDGQDTPVPIRWVWADIEQDAAGYPAVDALIDEPGTGWGINGQNQKGSRRLLVLTDALFRLEEPDDLTLRLAFEAEWDGHAFARVRTQLARVEIPDGLQPVMTSWYQQWFLGQEATSALVQRETPPEHSTTIAIAATDDDSGWSVDREVDSIRSRALDGPEGSVFYFAREIYAPRPTTLDLRLDRPNGCTVFLNGTALNTTQPPGSAEARVAVALRAGRNLLVKRIVHADGVAVLSFRFDDLRPGRDNDLVAAWLPGEPTTALQERLLHAWQRSPHAPFGEVYQAIGAAESRIKQIESRARKTMVMRELPEPRMTHVLVRGEYDHPDPQRPVQRGVPGVLGPLPDDAPPNRLGLARWLTAAEHPLTARVAVNRIWMTLFGAGLVRTPEDFGFQGEWPTHPELLDQLAVDFRESGWDVRGLLRRIVSSATYRQSSAFRPDVFAHDPDNRLLARYPARRLWAEQIRDQALYQAGLLVEQVGGPGVKPYQPTGLWREVAMPASNTRNFVRGGGRDLYRRSLYTYWKRAAPPPTMRAFDAPTREFCTIQRATTETPLQALALWNDEQFVEAARVLAQRSLQDDGSDRARLARIFRLCTATEPTTDELKILEQALSGSRTRFGADPEAAEALLAVGEAPGLDDPVEVAAWTMVASTVMNLYRVNTVE